MKVVFLGTSGSLPTSRRGSSSVVVRVGRGVYMFDCGEGTQRQMVRAGVGFRRKMAIFLSHLHGDHVLGLPGLLQSMSLLGRERRLDVYGPVGTVGYVKAFSEALRGPSFPVIIHEIMEPGVVYGGDGLEVVAVRSSHRVKSFSYGLFEEPRPGRFHPEKARALGVPEGRLWHRLQHGEPVTVEGRRVEPMSWPGAPTCSSTRPPSPTSCGRGRRRTATPRPGRPPRWPGTPAPNGSPWST